MSDSRITGKFVRRRFQDSGKDQAPDYYVYEFTNIIDDKGKKLADKWIKETALMRAVPFQKGKTYEITLSGSPDPFESVRLSFSIEVVWEDGRVYMKGGNSIIKVAKDGRETNLSVPFNRTIGVSNYDTAALNKLNKGLMTEELLLRMNAKGIFYQVHDCDPQDKRKFGGCSVGYSRQIKQNQVLIQKETRAEIDRALEAIKRNYVTDELEKHFTFKTEILQPKKGKR